MHCHNAKRWQYPIHYTKNTFFDLPGVPGAADQDALVREIEDGKVALPRAVDVRIRLEPRGAQDVPFGGEVGDLLLRGAEEHVGGEEVGPGLLREHTEGAPVFEMRSDKGVAGVESLAIEVGEEIFMKPGGVVGADGLVDVSPPDLIGRDAVLDDEAVLGTSAGEPARVDGEGACVGESSFSREKGPLNELRGSEIPPDLSGFL